MNPHSSIECHSNYHLWLNANGTCLMGKIKHKCQIGDLKSEVTCYVIDVDTSYNLLLGRPWIHRKSIVPFTLHQVMKYVDEGSKVLMLIAERHPFKRVENYFTDSLLYQDFLKANENPPPKEPDSGNEADVEPKAKEECIWELNPFLMSIDKLDVNNTANDVGEWYINEDLDLAYFSVFASNSIPLDTSTDIDDDLWSAIDALTSLQAPVRSSLVVFENISDVQGSFFDVLA